MRTLCFVAIIDTDHIACAAQHQRAADRIGTWSDFFGILVSWVMEFCIQSASGGNYSFIGDAEFKLSVVAAFDVPGISGVGSEIFTDNIFSGVDMV